MSGARSTKGCHTCRVRKKKCDEQHPICLSCISRNITCYGYGPKPDWMDGGQKEEGMTRSIRKAAERNYRERRKPWNKAKAGVIPNRDLPDRGVKSGNEEDGTGGRIITWDSKESDSGKGAPFSFPGEEVSVLPAIYSPGGMKFQPRHAGRLLPPKQASQSLPMHPLFWDSGLSAISPSQPIRPSNELALLMHYIDIVFPLQFGFYGRASPTPDRGRGWVLQLALRSNSFYHTAISISTSHQDQVRVGTTNIKTSTKLARHHALGVKALKDTIDDMHQRELMGTELWEVAWEVLACMSNLLSVEVFRGIAGHWQMHLTAARTLLSMIASKLNASVPGLTHRDIYMHILKSTSSPQASFFLTTFVWCDIISQATSLQPPAPPSLNFQFLLSPVPENPNGPPLLDLQYLMGCANWAMLALLDIAILSAWKRSPPPAPSATEIILSAVPIRQRITAGITTLRAQRQSMPQWENDSAEYESSIVTELFALAAMIYLSVVVRGARPHHPDIRSAMSDALPVLGALPRNLLLRVSWPLCIIGCMAVGEAERDVVREVVGLRNGGDGALGGVVKTEKGMVGIITMRDGGEGNSGTAWKAMRVVEECWRIHDLDAEREYGWVDAMATLDLKILLV